MHAPLLLHLLEEEGKLGDGEKERVYEMYAAAEYDLTAHDSATNRSRWRR